MGSLISRGAAGCHIFIATAGARPTIVVRSPGSMFVVRIRATATKQATAGIFFALIFEAYDKGTKLEV